MEVGSSPYYDINVEDSQFYGTILEPIFPHDNNNKITNIPTNMIESSLLHHCQQMSPDSDKTSESVNQWESRKITTDQSELKKLKTFQLSPL